MKLRAIATDINEQATLREEWISLDKTKKRERVEYPAQSRDPRTPNMMYEVKKRISFIIFIGCCALDISHGWVTYGQIGKHW